MREGNIIVEEQMSVDITQRRSAVNCQTPFIATTKTEYYGEVLEAFSRKEAFIAIAKTK